MFKNSYNVVGVMSGTSLDGIDLAYIHFTIDNGKWSFKIDQCETIPYPIEWLNKLKIAVGFSKEELIELNQNYTAFLGETIRSFLDKNWITDLDAVCSHGHTILHQPQNGFTLQIGNLPEIAQFVGTTVVCDFRVQDVQLGGQGAPLVPIGDRILFPDFDYCLNLGGFSNVSFENDGKRIAFDISPVNTVLNFYANQLGFEYDDQGAIARSGKIDKELLSVLNALDFYQKPFPKSLGFEFVKASAYAKIVNCVTNISALIVFTKEGNYILSLAILMAVFNIIGSFIGSSLALKKGNGFVRIIFLIIVSIMILKYGYDVLKVYFTG